MPEKIDIVVMDTGARRPEVLGLRLEDVDLDTGRLTVTGKGSRTRVIQVGASLKRVAGPIRCAFRCRRQEGLSARQLGRRHMMSRVGGG